MEIDFLGLNSSKCRDDGILLSNKKDFTDSDEGVEISLSLSTAAATTSLDSRKEIVRFPQKKSWAFPSENLISSCSSSSSSSSNTMNNLAYYNRESTALRTEQPNLVLVPSLVFLPSSTTGFPYNLNNMPNNLRNTSRIPADPASLHGLYSGCGNSLKGALPEKADKTMYMAAQAPIGHPSDATKHTRGHTPTIAMARKATLARFLEKRLHRMNQAGTNNLMGKQINATNSEVGNTSDMKCKKKKYYGTRERLQ